MVDGDAVGRLAAIARRSFPELGFCLGTRGQMFWLEEGHPASLAPGKRPRTTLSPTLALRDGDAVPRLGLARRRPAGPVDHAVLPAPRPRRHEPAGGDRRAGLALRAFPDFVLAAHVATRRAPDREARSARRLATSSRGAATSSRSSRNGRKAASPRRPRTARAAAPPPIRAACRAMLPGARTRARREQSLVAPSAKQCSFATSKLLDAISNANNFE